MISSYLKNFRKNKLAFLIISILFVIVAFIYVYFSEGYAEYKDFLGNEAVKYGLSLEVYYYMQSTMTSILLTLVLFLGAANFFSVDKLIDKQTHFSNMIKCRVGHKNYYKNMLIINSVYSFLYYICLQITLIIAISILIGPFNFSEIQSVDFITYYNIFSNSEFISFIIYILFSSIGFVLFSDFIYTLSAWIKNTYIFRGIGIIAGILLTALPAVIFVSLKNILGSELILDIGSPFFLPNLINPGLQYLGGHMIANSPYITYFVSLLFALILVVTLNRILMIKEHKND